MKKNINRLFEYNTDLLSGAFAEEAGEDVSTSNEPITPVDQMATQRSVDLPPIEDPSYVPATPKELGHAASLISQRCPQDQVSTFYKQMLDMVEKLIDTSREVPENCTSIWKTT